MDKNEMERKGLPSVFEQDLYYRGDLAKMRNRQKKEDKEENSLGVTNKEFRELARKFRKKHPEIFNK